LNRLLGSLTVQHRELLRACKFILRAGDTFSFFTRDRILLSILIDPFHLLHSNVICLLLRVLAVRLTGASVRTFSPRNHVHQISARPCRLLFFHYNFSTCCRLSASFEAPQLALMHSAWRRAQQDTAGEYPRRRKCHLQSLRDGYVVDVRHAWLMRCCSSALRRFSCSRSWNSLAPAAAAAAVRTVKMKPRRTTGGRAVVGFFGAQLVDNVILPKRQL